MTSLTGLRSALWLPLFDNLADPNDCGWPDGDAPSPACRNRQ